MTVPIWVVPVVITIFLGLIGLIWALVMERVRSLENWKSGFDLNIPDRVDNLETWRGELDMEFWPMKSKVESLQRGVERLEVRQSRGG
jgi:hypothetical protein